MGASAGVAIADVIGADAVVTDTRVGLPQVNPGWPILTKFNIGGGSCIPTAVFIPPWQLPGL